MNNFSRIKKISKIFELNLLEFCIQMNKLKRKLIFIIKKQGIKKIIKNGLVLLPVDLLLDIIIQLEVKRVGSHPNLTQAINQKNFQTWNPFIN